MMNRLLQTLLLAVVLCLCMSSFGAEFPVAAIPGHLLVNANVVKRYENISFEIVSTRETVLKKKYALTVLNEDGAGYAVFQERYDGLRQIRNIEGRLLDATGRELRSVKNKDVKDLSAISGISIYEDDRVKQHSFDYHVYPHTVVYEVTIRFNHSFYFEPWMPQDGPGVAVEESRFTLVSPEGYQVRTKAFHYADAPEVHTSDGKRTQVYVLKNKKAIYKPYAAPPWYELTTTLFLGPTDFNMGGMDGKMDSWRSLGQFQYRLNEGLNGLPDAVKEEVAKRCSGVATTREKIATLYDYLQQNTRYISVQLGIGGWKPFDAAYVAKNRYGDCKALSNFMYSLLEAAGIPAHYALIRAGRDRDARQMLEDFPSNQFNHAVLCVPTGADTTWLECTSQTDPFGYMGSFTGNRKALLVTPQGGALVATPRYGIAENLQERTIRGKLDPSGNLTATVNTRYTGIQQDSKEDLARSSDRRQVLEQLNEEYDLPSYEVLNFAYRQQKKHIPQVDEQLELDVPRYATVSGKRLFVLPNLLGQSNLKLARDTTRNCDYVFDLAYRDVDSVTLELPAGYTPEALPQPVKLQTPYGLYHYSVSLKGAQLQMVRVVEQYAVRVPPAEAEEMIRFWDAVYKTDRGRVVLVKEEASKPEPKIF